MSAEFLHEIDETLRAERMSSLWQTYRWAVVGGVAILFVGLAGFEWYRTTTRANQLTAATSYWSAVKDSEGNNAEALEKVAAASKLSHEGYRTLASLRLANMYAGVGKTAEAITLFETVAGDSKADATFRDLAKLMAAQLLMATDAAKAESMLSDLRTNNSPFMYSAMEFQAMLAENQNNKSAALNLYKQLLENDTALPAGIRDRAQMRVAALEAERDSQ
ncbi:MAG: tetratricopeptide repeat protein [Proteobacteria bacterium]|nr:tetratricopeptide repeat protein [Pseudomonadota bacterium]